MTYDINFVNKKTNTKLQEITINIHREKRIRRKYINI